MTQATHTQAICQPQPGFRLRARPIAAVRRAVARRRIDRNEPENLAGFSSKYRAEARARDARQRAASLIGIAYLGHGRH